MAAALRLSSGAALNQPATPLTSRNPAPITTAHASVPAPHCQRRTLRARTTRLATDSATPLTTKVAPPRVTRVPAPAPIAVKKGEARMAGNRGLLPRPPLRRPPLPLLPLLPEGLRCVGACLWASVSDAVGFARVSAGSREHPPWCKCDVVLFAG